MRRQRPQDPRRQRQQRQPPQRDIGFLVIGIGRIARQPEQQRRHAERQCNLARRGIARPGKIHFRRGQTERLPAQPAIEQHRPPGIGSAAERRFHFGFQPVELVTAQRRAVAGLIDQRARRPRRIIKQRAVPVSRRIMDSNRPRRGIQAAGAIMIVERMKAADMQQPGAIPLRFCRVAAEHVPGAIKIARRPATPVGFHRHAFRAQREQRGGQAIGAGRHLDIGIAVQQQLRRQRFEEPRPRRAEAGTCQHRQRRVAGRVRYQRRAARPLGDKPDCPRCHRVGQKAFAHLRLVSARRLAPLPGRRPARDARARRCGLGPRDRGCGLGPPKRRCGLGPPKRQFHRLLLQIMIFGPHLAAPFL